MLGNPPVTGMAYTGGAFLGFTFDGLYRSADPTAGWDRTAFQGIPVDMLVASGDTVVARDSARLLLTVDGGRTWSSVDPPYAPQAIKYAALAWSSICLLDTGTTVSQGIQCGSLSGLALRKADGIRQDSGLVGSIHSLRLNWGRIEGPLPGGHGAAVSAGVDGRIRPALRAR